MSFIWVFAATAGEGKALGRRITPGCSGAGVVQKGQVNALTHMLELFITGIGPRAARSSSMSAREALQQGRRPDAVLVIGTCGSLSAKLWEGQIVLYTDCISTFMQNMKPLGCAGALVERLSKRLVACGLPHARVRAITAERMAASRAEKLRWAETGAEVIDMESYEIIEAMAGTGAPVAVIRAVSDSLDRDLPDFNPSLKPNGEINRLTAARIAAQSPLRTLRFMALQRRALRRLRTALESLLSADSF